MSKRIERTRNAGTWTESQYWQHIRSAIRRAFRFWKPAQNAKLKARRKYEGENKRIKWEYQCKECKGWFLNKDIEIDHEIPCGSCKSLEDLPGFIERMSIEDENMFNILCKSCHQEKTNKERTVKK